MLRPHKVQPAGHEELYPGFIRVSKKWHYVTHVQCSCLITLESTTYSVSPEKRRLHPAGHGWQPINRDPLFQMCVCGGIVIALCVCTLLVAMSVWKQHAKTLWPVPITNSNKSQFKNQINAAITAAEHYMWKDVSVKELAISYSWVPPLDICHHYRV